MTIKQVKRGTMITLKDIEYPNAAQVWIRGEYIRETKKYELTNYDDVSRFRYVKGEKECFTDFIF